MGLGLGVVKDKSVRRDEGKKRGVRLGEVDDSVWERAVESETVFEGEAVGNRLEQRRLSEGFHCRLTVFGQKGWGF